MSPSDAFRCELLPQGRMQLALPFLVFGVYLVVAVVANVIVRLLGVAEQPVIAASMVLLALVALFAVRVSRMPQGRVELTPEQLSVKPRFRKERRVVLGTGVPTLEAWFRQSATGPRVAGPLLTVQGGGEQLSVGCLDPKRGEAVGDERTPGLVVPPSFLVKPEDFDAMLRRVGRELPWSS